MCQGGEIMTGKPERGRERPGPKTPCKKPKPQGGTCKYNESFMVLLPTTVGVYFHWASVISPRPLLDDDL